MRSVLPLQGFDLHRTHRSEVSWGGGLTRTRKGTSIRRSTSSIGATPTVIALQQPKATARLRTCW